MFHFSSQLRIEQYQCQNSNSDQPIHIPIAWYPFQLLALFASYLYKVAPGYTGLFEVVLVTQRLHRSAHGIHRSFEYDIQHRLHGTTQRLQWVARNDTKVAQVCTQVAHALYQGWTQLLAPRVRVRRGVGQSCGRVNTEVKTAKIKIIF